VKDGLFFIDWTPSLATNTRKVSRCLRVDVLIGVRSAWETARLSLNYGSPGQLRGGFQPAKLLAVLRGEPERPEVERDGVLPWPAAPVEPDCWPFAWQRQKYATIALSHLYQITGLQQAT